MFDCVRPDPLGLGDPDGDRRLTIDRNAKFLSTGLPDHTRRHTSRIRAVEDVGRDLRGHGHDNS